MKPFLSVCLSLCIALLAQGQVRADVSAAAGTITSIVGNPKISTDGGKTFSAVQLGDFVPVGALIRTGSGKVGVLLSDGSIVRLAQNSEITLTEHDPANQGGGTILNLAAGFCRFLVSKVKPGNHFEVHTDNAVAAVKGTDWEIGIEDGGKTFVWVFPHDGQGKVEFGNPGLIAKALVLEAEFASFDGKSVDHGSFDPKTFIDHFDGLKDPASGGPVQPTPASSPAPAPQSTPATAPVVTPPVIPTPNVNGDLNQINQQMAQLAQQMKNSIQQTIIQNQNQVAQQEQADVLLQRYVTDQNGDETLVTHSVLFPEADEVDLLTTDLRTAGVNAGVTSVNELTQFNTAIGSNWMGALKSLPSPSFYRLETIFSAENPSGDLVEAVTSFGIPFLLSTFYVQNLSGEIETLCGGPNMTPTISLFALTATNIDAAGEITYSNAIGGDTIGSSWQIAANSLGTEYFWDDSTLSGEVFSENVLALTATGPYTQANGFGVASEYNVANSSSYDATLGGQPYSVEMTFHFPAETSAAGIDTVFLPGYYDLYYVSPLQNASQLGFAP